jgi:hypothetical protein
MVDPLLKKVVIPSGSKIGFSSSDVATKGTTEVRIECLSQGNFETDEILIDISVTKYDKVCNSFLEEIMSGSFTGCVPPKAVIRS